MGEGMTKYKALQINLCAAGTTVMLCRANLEKVELSEEEKADLLWRLECQINELESMRLEVIHLSNHDKPLRKSCLRLVE